MAAPLNRSKTLPPTLYHDDAHWKKFKEAVHRYDSAQALDLMRAYQYKRIDGKIDQLILELVDGNQPREILFLVQVLQQTDQVTEVSRICQVGAQILSGTQSRKRNPNIPILAEGYAIEYRRWQWKKRAAFMEMIAKLGKEV
ncbi:MAG: hypothetical protein K1X28_07930 [Parachlamydiales bacterium]|nr:hypothetical protein [Parachlamydiales bacterium]